MHYCFCHFSSHKSLKIAKSLIINRDENFTHLKLSQHRIIIICSVNSPQFFISHSSARTCECEKIKIESNKDETKTISFQSLALMLRTKMKISSIKSEK